jgi:hypothetical protein
MVVGDSQPFRLVDQDGRTQHNVSWSVSDPDALQPFNGDEFMVIAKKPGDFYVRAHSTTGNSEATIKVVKGNSIPYGAAKWTGPQPEGCKVQRITPAVPSASGVDVFATVECRDGQYLEAYRADGIQVWRKKLSGNSGPSPGPGAVPTGPAIQNPTAPNRLNATTTSICDVISLGTPQENIRELLDRHGLSFQNAPQDRAWSVEESGTRCKLWFDDSSVLTKKRKVIVSE